jgi:hypothetical protein
MRVTEILDYLNADTVKRHVLNAFSQSKRLRSWALADDTVAQDGLMLIAMTWQAQRAEHNKNFDSAELRSFFENELAEHVPSIALPKPTKKKTLPQVWTDPVTNLPAVNPWTNDDRASQNAVLKADPALA